MHVRNEPFTRNKEGIITFMKLMTIVISLIYPIKTKQNKIIAVVADLCNI